MMGSTRFEGKDNFGKPKQEYLDKLSAKDDEGLFEEAKQMIWFSAYASNNPRSDYHWQCDAVYAECSKRKKINIYQRAYDYNTKG